MSDLINESIDNIVNNLEVPFDNGIEEENVEIEDQFEPTIDEEEIITEISPANFDNMTKILAVLCKENNDTIMIRDSIIIQSNVDNIIQADMSQILKNKKNETVSLDIIDPKKYVKLFSQFAGNNNIFIISDDENSRFIVTNGEIKLFLPKQDNMVQQNNSEIFEISDEKNRDCKFCN